jgi:RNA polymerase sigma factor (sigma-70 family)
VAKISQKPQGQLHVDDGYLIALAKQGNADAYDRLVRRYYSFVRLKASSYFLIGGDSDDLIQEGLVGLYKAIRDFRTDRESSFRNFAELCITRQIITAVKTATRNKHTPLNGYVSFSATPAGATESEPTLDEVLPGSTTWDPGQPGHLLRGAALAGRMPEHGALGPRVARPVALPRRLLLHRHRRDDRLRLQDRRQRAPAREAQGRGASRLARGARLDPQLAYLM